jgi:hypothetical protein
MRIKKQYAL